MQNPYAPSTPIRNENSVGHRITLNLGSRLFRSSFCGIAGYFAPFVILIPLFALKFGWHPIGEQIEGLADWHWPITLAGWALLIPNMCCVVFFGFAGYTKNSPTMPSARFIRWLSLGVATLIGYAAMLTIEFIFDPWPASWSAERTNLLQSVITLSLPAVVTLHWLLGRSKAGGEPCDATEPGLHGFTNGKSNLPAR